MLNFKKDNVDIYNPINTKKDEIVDAFVQVYGEKYRSTIKKQIDETEFICLFGGGEVDYLSSSIISIRNAMTKLAEVIKVETGIDITDSNNLSEDIVEALKQNEKYLLYVKGQKIAEEYSKALSEYDESMENDCRYKELFSKLKDEGVKDLESATRVVWKWAKSSFAFSIARTVSFPTNQNKYKQFCFLDNGLALDDKTTIHEIGHVIETFILKEKNGKALEKTGFELIMQGDTIGIEYDSKGKMVKTQNKRRYEAFNEIINEYISIKVTKKLNEKNINIGLIKSDFEDSPYSSGFKVFGDFIEKHIDKIIACKMSSDGKEIGEFFGFENFNQLADLATQYLRNAESNKDNSYLEQQILNIFNNIESQNEIIM